jgi:hypothetical protein
MAGGDAPVSGAADRVRPDPRDWFEPPEGRAEETKERPSSPPPRASSIDTVPDTRPGVIEAPRGRPGRRTKGATAKDQKPAKSKGTAPQAKVVPSTKDAAAAPAIAPSAPPTDPSSLTSPVTTPDVVADVVAPPESPPTPSAGTPPTVTAPTATTVAVQPERIRLGRPRVRRVTRVLRHVDTWTVFKVAVIFHAVLYAVLLVAGVLLWSVGVTTGTVDNVESFITTSFALDSFSFDGQQLFRGSWILGAVLGVAGVAAWTAGAVLFNLIADLVGGIRVTVLEEEVIRRPVQRRRIR